MPQTVEGGDICPLCTWSSWLYYSARHGGGDGRMPEFMFTITGSIALPSAQLFEDAVAIVGLDDVSRIDAPSVRVAEMIIPVRGRQHRIPFRLTAEESSLTGDSFVLSAEIRSSEKSRLRPGDFLTTAAFPWRRDDTADMLLQVEKI